MTSYIPPIPSWSSDEDRSGDLAASAFTALSPTARYLSITINHAVDHGWTDLRKLLRVPEEYQGKTETPENYVEGALSVAYGTRTAVTVTRKADPSKEDDETRRTHPPHHFQYERRPSFLYDTARYVEVFLSCPLEGAGSGRLSEFDAAAVSQAIFRLARAARDSGAAILMMEAPASRPETPREDDPWTSTGDRDLREASSVGVRFAVGIPEPGLEHRHAFWVKVRHVAEDTGMEAWAHDRRKGRAPGKWFLLSAGNWPRYKAGGTQTPKAVSPDYDHVVPISCVGPARVGTTSSILSKLNAAGCLVVGASVTALADYAIINLSLASSGPSHHDGKEACARLPRQADAQELESVLTDAGCVNIVPRADVDGAGTAASLADYSYSVSAPIQSSFDVPTDRSALWARWDVPLGPRSLGQAIKCLGRAVRSVSPSDPPRIEYLLARRVEPARLRGRIKLSIDRGQFLGAFDEPLDNRADYCLRVEEAWQDQIRRSLARQGLSQVAEVQVVWREMWLGRWASSP